MIPLPQKIKIISHNKTKATFEIPGLYPGYGVTLGNSLRRVLLSSLEGAAITQVKIKGVAHEFSTIDGVLEDVLTILLNLKKLRFKMYTDEPQVGVLKVKGEKEVKGGDFKLPSQVEIVNKDQHIATITDKKTELEIEIFIEKGIGYEPVERRKKEKLPIGAIAIDAIYMPIKKVSFKTENMRVGERTDFDRLFLEIETDGTKTPEQALKETIEILIKMFSFIGDSLTTEKEERQRQKTEEKEPKQETRIKIEDLGLSSSTTKILLDNKIKTVAGLLRKKEEDLLALKGIGEKGLEEIKKTLKKLNLELKK